MLDMGEGTGLRQDQPERVGGQLLPLWPVICIETEP